jgi:hypothetical protein
MDAWKEIIVADGDEPLKPNPVKAPIVEDTQTVGGIDKTTGAPVIRAKTPEGGADALTEATDPQENK